MIFFDTTESTLGALKIYATEKGLVAITYNEAMEIASRRDTAKLKPYKDAIRSYLNGDKTAFDHLALDLQWGTDLQRNVWTAIHRIPYGTTISYSDLAVRVGKPSAVRAVGSACGKNPVPLVIPCHRVLAKNGGLGGFTWGLDVKKKLLKLEQGAKAKKAA